MIVNRIVDAIPNPWNRGFLFLLVGASALAATVAGIHAGSDAIVPGIAAIASAILAVYGRLKLSNDSDSPSGENISSDGGRTHGYVFLGGAFLVALAALMVGGGPGWRWAVVIAPFVILALCPACFRTVGILPLVIIPLLFSFVIFDSASLMGEPGAGSYPSVFAFFLVLVGLTTRRLEVALGEDTSGQGLHRRDHHRTLAILSTLFFFFGVISFWPWLGKIYGPGYFWVMVIGVLGPLLYLWGRLKQPHDDSPLQALQRFNRVLPYIGLILLIAIILG
jgi:hypothetical protein